MSVTVDASTQVEEVVLLDPSGQPCGVAPKATVHQERTPYHLAFSCYVFDEDGRLLVTRRALSKVTWPGFWTNSCCGHPLPGESIEDAVRRRLDDELGLASSELILALPDFSYRAQFNGIEEYELCPVYLALSNEVPHPNAAEVAEYCWTSFEEFAARTDLSPWAALQVIELRQLFGGHAPNDVRRWLHA